MMKEMLNAETLRRREHGEIFCNHKFLCGLAALR